MSETFYEGEELLAEITDSLLVVHKGTQKYEYRLDSLTGARPIFSHQSEPKHVVVFGVEGGSGQTTGVDKQNNCRGVQRRRYNCGNAILSF